MRNLAFITALVISASSPCGAQPSTEDRIKELDEKIAALQKEKASLMKETEEEKSDPPSDLFDGSGKVKSGIANAVLVIEGDQSVGTGFIVSTGGKYYIYTAAHVFSGNSKLTIRNNSGTTFRKFGPLEAAEGADLIRMEILEKVTDSFTLFPPESDLQINTHIAALGNGGGNGVIALEKGSILGTSADSLEVDAGIIQGNSGGPVVELSSSKAVGLVTHLTSARKDQWSEGTRQGEIRRFACRLNKEWQWKPMNIGTFLANAKAVEDYDNLTKICFAVASLRPSEEGLRVSADSKESPALTILQDNLDNVVVKNLVDMNSELGSRKTSLSIAERNKRFRSLLGQLQSQASRSRESFKPQGFAWFHRKRAEGSVEARAQSMENLARALDRVK